MRSAQPHLAGRGMGRERCGSYGRAVRQKNIITESKARSRKKRRAVKIGTASAPATQRGQGFFALTARTIVSAMTDSWESAANRVVAMLRMDFSAFINDESFSALISGLRNEDGT
jgi:hypothetical protein